MGLHSLRAPIAINGQKAWAIPDSGAERSLIDFDYCVQRGITIAKRDGTLGSAFDGQIVQRIGVARVQVQCKEHVIHWNMEVARLNSGSSEVVVLLGADIFPHIDIHMVGIPVSWPGQQSSGLDIEPLTDEDRLFQFKEEVPETDRQAAIRKWQPLLDANAAISPLARCSIPGAILHIDTGDAAPTNVRQYPIAPHEREEVTKKVAEWLAKGIIEVNAHARWTSPIVVVPKKDEHGNKVKYRICMDLRKLNQTIVHGDEFPVPMIEHVFMRMGGKKFYTTLDMAEGYHQIAIKESDREKVAFVWNGVHYQFTSACFGLKTMTSVFQRIMTEAMADLEFVAVYVDDLTIASDTYEEHVQHVSEVLRRLNAANIRLNLKKNHFCSSWARVLGHIVTRQGRQIDPEKVKAITTWVRPETVSGLLTFLGSTSWTREYAADYARVAAPLDSLRHSKGKIDWTPERIAAFEGIKRLFREGNGILHAPDLQKPMHLAVDASQSGLGACLYQVADGTSRKQVIFCISRSLRASERNYSATKRELLAIIWAVRRLRDYLIPTSCILHTDHKPLTHLMTQKHVSPMLNTWVEELLQYDITIQHVPGTLNVVADGLSRRYEDQPVVRNVQANASSPKLADAVARELQTEFGIGMGAVLVAAESKGKRLAAPSQRRSLLETAHNKGHGSTKVIQQLVLDDGFWWPGMYSDAERFVTECDQCMKNNVIQAGYHPLRPAVTLMPMELVGVDLITPLPQTVDGFNTLLVVVDYFSRSVLLKPCVAKSSITIGKALWEIFTTIGFPQRIRSDNGGEFVNAVLDGMCAQFGVAKELVPAYEHHGNGLVERTNRTIREMLRKHTTGAPATWVAWVPHVQYSYNTRRSSLTNSTPFALMFGRIASEFGHRKFGADALDAHDLEVWHAHLKQLHAVVYPAIVEKSKFKRDQMVGHHEKRHRIMDTVPSGAVVFVRDPTRTSKMEAIYEGPYVVVGQDAVGAYIVRDRMGVLLRRHIPAHDLRLTPRTHESLEEPDAIYVVVESISKHERVGDGYRYWVHWKDRDVTYDQWVKDSDFQDQSIIRDYWKQQAVAAQAAGVLPVLGGVVKQLPVRQSERLATKRGSFLIHEK